MAKKKSKPKGRRKKRAADSEPRSPQIDYTSQAAVGEMGAAPQDLGHYIFALASEVSRRWSREGKREGMLFVIGTFKSEGKKRTRVRARGMRQLGRNPIDRQLLRADSPEFAEMLYRGEEVFGDGAIVIDVTGQVLGSGAYLVVDHPEAKIPEEGGSRHLAAASASMREDIVASVVISEETGRVRLFENGKVSAFFDPVKEEKT